MKLATIAPVYDLDLCKSTSDLYLILSWLCKENKQYKHYWTNTHTGYKILDNGANEGKLSDDLDILNLADDIYADEIVAPDAYLDAEATLSKTETFLGKYYESRIKGNFKVMAVAQGKSQQQFMDCYNEFLLDPRIDVIGIGYRNLYEPFEYTLKDLTDETWTTLGIENVEYLREEMDEKTFLYTLSRIHFLKTQVDYTKLKDNNKQLHMLGLYNPFELTFFKGLRDYKIDCIRGVDSAAACQAAQASVKFDKTFGVKDKPQAFLDFEQKLPITNRLLATQNIEIMKEWFNE